MKQEHTDTQQKLRCLVIGVGDWRGYLAYKQRTMTILKAFESLGWEPRILWFSRISKIAAGEFTVRRKRIGLPMLPFYSGHRFICQVTHWICHLLIRIIVATRRVDLIMAECPTAAAIAAGTGVPLICDFHGDAVEERKTTTDRGWKISLVGEDERSASRSAAGWICVSGALRDVLRTRHGVSVPSSVMPCSVDIPDREALGMRRQRSRAELGVGDRPVICYAGGLAPYQEIPRTLQLVAHMRAKDPDVFFLLITRDDTGQYAQALAALGDEGKDYRCMSLSHAEVLDLLPAADLGVLLRASSPMNHVSSPTKCGEYLASGVPVLTTEYAGDAPHIIEEAVAGLVLHGEAAPEKDADMTLEFLHRAMENRSAIAERSHRAASQFYNASRGAERIGSLLHEVFRSRSLPAITSSEPTFGSSAKEKGNHEPETVEVAR